MNIGIRLHGTRPGTLPEKPMKHLILRNCRFDFDPEAQPMVPAMALNVEECYRRGIIAGNLEKLTDVLLEGIEGEPLETPKVREIETNAER